MICNKCKQDKPETNFPVRSRRLANGKKERCTTCRSCKRLKNLKRGLCQCGRPLATKTLCETCRKRTAANGKKRAEALKLEILKHYGGKCVFCEEYRPIFLTIDHIDGNGAEHRRKEKINTGSKTYRWLKKNKFPKGFQVACFNCNAAKVRIGEEGLRQLLDEDK
jgi:hypothetical protein